METVQKLTDELQTVAHLGKAQNKIKLEFAGQRFEVGELNLVDDELIIVAKTES